MIFLAGSVSADGYMVEFEGDSVTESSIASSEARSQVREVQADFRDYIEREDLSVSIRNSYTDVFNGMSIEVNRSPVIERISQLDYVEDVRLERNYSAKLDMSVPKIGAPETWKRQVSGVNLTGEDVNIAILDTGVAYNHSALGSCTTREFKDGECQKVRTGYDFHNSDPDPMDNGGHGTHVSGTSAGNGSLKGVAPDASIDAYKVLGVEYGSTGDIVAGIEAAYKNGSDIISMSLGGGGNPDDDLSVASDNAAEAGVLVVAAAGNNEAYETIGSPGTSLQALTVGAVDLNDDIASFSSRGPVFYNSTIFTKPEIVAPGTAICAPYISDSSFCESGNYASLQGTSMATPHVSGAAAILRQKYPVKTEDEIKSLLTLSADPTGHDVFTTGAGRLNVSRAVQMGFHANRSVLNLRNVTGTESVRKIEFTNMEDSSRTLMLNGTGAEQYEGDENASVFEDMKIELSPGESRTLELVFDVSSVSGYFSGRINITDDTSGYMIPYSFGKYNAHRFTAINHSDIVGGTQAEVNFSIRKVEYNTTVRLYSEDGGRSTVWENSSNTSGSFDASLIPGQNRLNLSVQRTGYPSTAINRSFEIISDNESPDMNVSFAPEILNSSSDPVKFDINVSDNYGVERFNFFGNSSGNWELEKTDRFYGSQENCSDIWGDCSKPPEEEQNTFGQCSPGSSNFESVNSLQARATGGVGDPVMVNTTRGEYGTYYQLAVNRSTGWEVIAEGKSDKMENVSFTPEKEGVYTVRASVSFDSIEGYCANSSAYYDNDDIRISVYNNTNYSQEIQPFGDGMTWFRVQSEDKVSNRANYTDHLKVNKAPRLSTELNRTIYENNDTLFMNYTSQDPESDDYSVYLNYSGPGSNLSKQISGGNTSFQIGKGFGQGNLSIKAQDYRGAFNYSNSTIYLSENVSPVLGLDEPASQVHLRNTSFEPSYSASDNYRLSNYSLYTNQSGEWKKNITGGDELDWSNQSYNGALKYGIRASDFFGNSMMVNGTLRVRELQTERNLTLSSARHEIIDPYSVMINRSGWNYTPLLDVNREKLELVGQESFEGDSSFNNKSFSRTNLSVDGNYSVKGTGDSPFIELNFSSNTSTLLSYEYRSDQSGTVSVEGGNGNYLFRTGDYWRTDSLVVEPGKKTVRWQAGSDAEFYLDNVSLSSFNRKKTFDFTPQRIGNYSFTYTNRRTGETVNRTYYANATDASGNLMPAVIPEKSVRNLTFSTDLTGASNFSVDAETGEVNGIWTEKIQRTDYGSGEPFNATVATIKVENLSQGRRDVEVNMTAVNEVNYTVTRQLEVTPYINMTTYVEDSRGEKASANLSYGSDIDPLVEFTVDGNDTRKLSNLSQFQGYQVAFQVNNTEEYFALVTERFSNITENQTFIYDSFRDVSDGDYRFDLVAYADYSETSKIQEFVYGDRTGTLINQTAYRCLRFNTDSRSCEDSWSEVELYDEGYINGSIAEAEALAYGEKQEQPPDDGGDDSGSDSGSDSGGSDSDGSDSGGSGGGGFTPRPDPDPEMEVNRNSSGVKVTAMDVEGSREVEIDTSGVTKINFTGEAEDAEVTVSSTQEPEIQNKEVHSAVEINTSEDLGATIGFTVSRDWFDDRNVAPENTSLHRYDGEWQELETRIKENRTAEVEFRADTPGFSRFAVAADSESGCETGSFPAVQDGSCTVYTNRCELPDEAREVESCSIWEDRNEAEDLVEQVESEVESSEAQQKIGEAIEALERDEYDIAVQKATEARNIEQQRQSGSIIAPIIALLVVGGLIGGGLLGYRIYTRKQTIRKLEELSELVRLEIQKGGVDDSRKVLKVLQRAEKDVENGDYDSASERLNEITRHL